MFFTEKTCFFPVDISCHYTLLKTFRCVQIVQKLFLFRCIA
uniref:Uncharacterized protein n=1 Tax=Arundo donax TaxID=35708 RepID=A0A0A9H4Z3_ARUDO